MPQNPIRVTVWHEHVHEKTNAQVQSVYPDGMHVVMKDAIEQQLGQRVQVRTALLEEPEHGLTDEVLASTDVMTWWGHAAHHKVDDAIAEKVQHRVLDGMGFIALHSAHFAKPFKRLMGTGCGIKWREAAERERLWIVNPGHPIVDGLGEYIELPHVEMYGEHFDIPQPDELVMISWFEGGEVFRSACTWQRGKGKVFYFRPGHETFPIYYDEHIRRVLGNAVLWAAPRQGSPYAGRRGINAKPLETIESEHEVDPSLHA